MLSPPPSDTATTPRPLPPPLGRLDLAIVLTLIASSLFVASPVLLGDGGTTYLDDGPHLAEIEDLAGEGRRGWSDIAFAGFPLGILHSPLWYGALAFLARAGLAMTRVMPLCLWLGLLAPSLALWHVARRRLAPLPSGALAFLFLIQAPGISGIASALGGMWTAYVATAFLVLLFGELARPRMRFGFVAAWTFAALVTHLFTIAPVGLALLARAAFSAWDDDRSPRTLALFALASLTGVVAASAYWLPLLVLARGATDIQPQNLPLGDLFGLLFTSADVLEALGGFARYAAKLASPSSWPMLLLAGLGFYGARLAARRDGDRLARLGLVVALALLALLEETKQRELSILGPVSWRMLLYVRVGLALAAIEAIRALGEGSPFERPKGGLTYGVSLGAVAVCSLVARAPLAQDIAKLHVSQRDDLAAVVRYVREHRTPSWGRVYAQDTFMNHPGGLTLSHEAVLAARETGADMLGSYYGIVPFRTRWTNSEWARLFEQRCRFPAAEPFLLVSMERTNATHLVITEPSQAKEIAALPSFRVLFATPTVTLFERVGAVSRWIEPSDGLTADVREHRGGRFVADVAWSGEATVLELRESFHPFWRVLSPPGATLGEEPKTGFLEVRGLRGPTAHVELEYRAPTFPWLLSALGCLGIAALFALDRRRAAV